ncbi:DUF4245 domain-containing protein [Dactylosporangium sp. NBC_01737]|uniref:DUF4245 domain-containing protein n=1 Tax=Dactylosporangium sp. NBC_01737 TaxID=2975959 RepID=UPI002E14F9BA|nr:DUF4245 domain-containing protein [Dactylosporangium sp. NBC_01737]
METAAPAPAVERAGRRPRDMALSMLVLLVPVFLLVGFYRFLGHEDPPAVDTTEVYGSVQRAGQFTPLKPTDLPQGWRIASATFTGGVLRIGVTAPSDGAMQVVESAQPSATLIPSIVGTGGAAGAPVSINGTEWQRHDDGRPGERALIQSATGRTVIIFGRATDSQLQRLASSLR